jgi:hypothetical protein
MNRSVSILAVALIGTPIISCSARAQAMFQTSGKITYLTFFGSGGPRSGETIVGSADAPGRACGYQDRFTGRIGYPATDASLKTYVRMHKALMRSYVRQRPISIRYRCTANLPEIVDVW